MATRTIRATWVPYRVLFPVLAALDLAFVLSRGFVWRGDWLRTIDWTGGPLLLLGPVAGGLAVWAVAWQRAVLGPFTTEDDRARATRALLGSELVILLGIHASLLGMASVITATTGSIPAPGDVGHALVQMSVLTGYISVGHLAGMISRSRLAPVGVAIVLLLMPAIPLIPSLWVEWGGMTGSGVGIAAREKIDALQVASGLSIGVFAWLVSASRRPWAKGAIAIGTGVAMVVVASLGLLAADQGPRFRFADDELVCTGGEVTICLLQDAVFAEPDLRAAVRDLEREFDELGVARIPTTLVQLNRDGTQSGEGLGFALPIEMSDRTAILSSLMTSIAAPQSACNDQVPTMAQYRRLATAGNVVLFRLTGDKRLEEDPVVRGLAAGSRTIVDPWLRQTLQAGVDCNLDDIPKLPAAL